jgi:hypothetical protein
MKSGGDSGSCRTSFAPAETVRALLCDIVPLAAKRP